MNILYFFGIYILGWLLCLLFLVKWGKKLGIDYGDNPNKELDYSNYDDWKSNQTAYPGMSCAWFMLILFGIGYLLWKGMTNLTSYLMSKLNKKDVNKDWFFCELESHPAHDRCEGQCSHCKNEWQTMHD